MAVSINGVQNELGTLACAGLPGERSECEVDTLCYSILPAALNSPAVLDENKDWNIGCKTVNALIHVAMVGKNNT
jgi:hypothetical protein